MASEKKTAKSTSPDEALSTDSQFSTYRAGKPGDLDNAPTEPAPGPHVIQELGQAKE